MKLSLNRDVKGIITMCAPMDGKTEDTIYDGFLDYARNFKNMKAKDQETIDKEMKDFHPTETLKELSETLLRGKEQVDEVIEPILVIQAEQDKMIDPQSANYIYEHVDSDEKDIKWYHESGHVITIDKEKEQVFEDVYQFLESLDWTE